MSPILLHSVRRNKFRNETILKQIQARFFMGAEHVCVKGLAFLVRAV
jgi:hypothetical protein